MKSLKTPMAKMLFELKARMDGHTRKELGEDLHRSVKEAFETIEPYPQDISWEREASDRK